MLYLVVDPSVLMLAPAEELRKDDLKRFINFMLQWEKTTQRYVVAFGITKECVAVLKAVTPILFNPDALQQTLEQKFPAYAYDELVKVVSEFWQMVLQNTFLDDARNELENRLLFEFNTVDMSPPQYFRRLDTLLQEEFKYMLGIIAFARRNAVMPLSDLEQIHVLTTLSDDERNAWAVDDSILISVHYDWALDENVEDWQTLQGNRQVIDELPVISSMGVIEALAQERNAIKTVLDAVQMAVQAYPDRLVLTRKAQDTAKKSGHQNPARIYEAITGLVTYWLPVYENTRSVQKAHDAYRMEVGWEISGAGQQVKQRPQLREQRTVTYNGGAVFAELHIKLGKGKNIARIYFAPVQEDDGTYKLVLVWVGKHADTARG